MNAGNGLVVVGLVLSASAYAANQVGEIAVGNSPFAVAIDAASSQAVVANLFPVKNADGTDGPNVRVLDLAARRELRAFRVGTRLVSVAVVGASALVVNEDQDAVRILDIGSGQQVGQIAVGSRPSSVLAVSDVAAIVTNGTSGDIMFLDIPARRVTATLAVGKDPRAVALHPSGAYAYVALGGDNSVAVVALGGAPHVVAHAAVGKNPVAVAFSVDGARAVVTNLSSNTVSLFDTSNPAAPRLLATAAVGAQPSFAAFGRLDAHAVYVSNQGANYVTVLDVAQPAARMVRGVIDLGTSSSQLVVGNGGQRLYVLEFRNDAKLRIFDLADLGTLDPKPVFEIPGEPIGVRTLAATGDCAADFYIAEATLAAGAREGYWGMEVGVSKDPRELKGGFNLGGGFDGGGRNPGFGAFSLSSPQTVSFTVTAQPLAGPIALNVDLRRDGIAGERIAGAQGTPSASSPLSFSASLGPGFYVVVIGSDAASGRGTFQLALGTAGSFAGGVVVGGFITRDGGGASLAGFGAFCVPATQAVTVKLFGASEYGAAASGDLVLTLRDHRRDVIGVFDTSGSSASLSEPPPAPPVPGNIRWYVDAKATGGNGSSASPFRSITAAINKAQAGDVIFVRKGTYSRSATGETLPIGSGGAGLSPLRPSVQVVGEGAQATVIDGENAPGNLVVIPASGVRFAGFTVKRSGAVGAYVFRASNVVIENVFATGNARFGLGGEGAHGLVVRNNVADGNVETGIAFVGSQAPAAAPAGAPGNCPAIPAGAYGAWIVGNTASNNRADGILTGGGGNYCVAGNTVANNGSSGIEFNNRSEAGASPPLRGAVVDNVATGNGGQQFAFAGTGILVAENGANVDLIQGNRLTRNRPYGIGIFLNAAAGRIVGNTVTDSTTTALIVRPTSSVTEIADNALTGNAVGGIQVDDHSTVQAIRNNAITGNDRGLSVLDHSKVALIENNIVDGNATVGIDVGVSSEVATISNTSASNNAAAAPAGGSGVQVRDGSRVGVLQGSRILNNEGQGGLFVSQGSTIVVSGTTIDGNAAQGVFAFGAGASVAINGGSIAGSRRDSSNQYGFGVNAQQGAQITCAGVLLAGNAGGNVFSAGGGAVTGCN